MPHPLSQLLITHKWSLSWLCGITHISQVLHSTATQAAISKVICNNIINIHASMLFLNTAVAIAKNMKLAMNSFSDKVFSSTLADFLKFLKFPWKPSNSMTLQVLDRSEQLQLICSSTNHRHLTVSSAFIVVECKTSLTHLIHQTRLSKTVHREAFCTTAIVTVMCKVQWLTQWHRYDWLGHKTEWWRPFLALGTHRPCQPQCHQDSYNNSYNLITLFKEILNNFITYLLHAWLILAAHTVW